MKRTTDRTTKCASLSRIAVGIALAAVLAPGTAFASSENPVLGTGLANESSVSGTGLSVATDGEWDADASEEAQGDAGLGSSCLLASVRSDVVERGKEAASLSASERIVTAVRSLVAEQTDKVLPYDPADIAAIGTQAATGHSICCPSFSCAYADAVLDGTVHDHGYYTCSCCSWTDWGGGDSSFRCVGSDEQLLREAYDQIAAGKPTVVHVAAGYGEHWIALVGYAGATDVDHLTLANFIALDPWDGAQVNAAERFSLYGDGCEHVSER